MKYIPTILLTVFITLALVFAGISGIVRTNEIRSSGSTERSETSPQLDYIVDDALSSYMGFDALPEAREQDLIKIGSIDMRVRDMDNAVDALLDIASIYEGEVTHRSIARYDDRYSGYATLQVPSADFEAALEDVKAIAEVVDSLSIGADDVTDQLVDINARLRAAVAEEARYLELLASATNIEDLLAIERELSRIRTTIERYEAQQQGLEDEVAFASLYVSMTKEITLPLEGTRFRPKQDAVEAFAKLALIARGITTALIHLLIIGGAISIPVALVYLLSKPFFSTYGKKRKK